MQVEFKETPQRHSQYRCSYCGKPVDLSWYDSNSPFTAQAYNEQLCVVCAYWQELCRHMPLNSFVINHHLISIGQKEELDFVKKMHYVLTDTGNVVKGEIINDYGLIPDEFRSLLPNNAQFVGKGMATKALDNKGYKCMRYGCWDRTHCLFYGGEIMDWNEIPASHKIGDEQCEIFIKKANL